MATIRDGTGNEVFAKVTPSHKLATQAETLTQEFQAILDGRAFNINTGTITLATGAQRSGLLYIKYTGTKRLIINSFIYWLGADTGGAATEDILVEIIRNPTAGTLISGGTSFDPSNRNFGSSNVLSATVLKGVAGNTVIDGTVAIESIFNGNGRQLVAVPSVLTPNTSCAIALTTRASTTSQDVQMAMAVYETEE